MEDTMFITAKTKTRQNVSLNDTEQMPVRRMRRIITGQSKHYRSIIAGWGRCSRCACIAFEEDYDNREVCKNCGHNYRYHD